MSITTADLGNLMKEVILPEIQNQVFRENIFTAELQKNKWLKLANGTFYIVSTTNGHSWVYSVAEWDDIEDGNFSTWKMQVKSKYTFGRHTFTDIALDAVDGDEGSLADVLVYAWVELKEAIKRQVNRQFEYWYWQWVIAKCWTWATWTTVTVLWESVYFPGTFYINPGEKLLIGTKAEIEAWTADEVTVLAITSSTTFTTTASFTYVTSDLIVKKRAYNASAAAYNEMAWFRNLIDNSSSPYDSSFQNIVRATNDWVNAPVYKNGWTRVTLTISRIREYVLKASKYGKPNLILMNSLLYDKYISLLEDKVRFTTVTMGTASFQWVWFASWNWDIPVMLSYDVPLDEVYIVDLSTWTIWEMSPMWFLDRDGQVLRNVWGNSAAFTSIMKFYWNLICLKPRANARLTDQKETA